MKASSWISHCFVCQIMRPCCHLLTTHFTNIGTYFMGLIARLAGMPL